MSIKEQLQNTPERGKEITGQELMALERFAEDTRHMIWLASASLQDNTEWAVM